MVFPIEIEKKGNIFRFQSENIVFLSEDLANMIPRDLCTLLRNAPDKRKALILSGARQVGKTTLLQEVVKAWENVLWLTGDAPETQQMFENPTLTRFQTALAGIKVLVVDEAQRLPNAGLGLQLITDHLTHIRLLVTGSSAVELPSRLHASLPGRTSEHRLYPISFAEMVNHHTLCEEKRLLPCRLVYGYYPDVVTHPGEAQKILQNLAQNLLDQEMLRLEGIKKPDKIVTLLHAIAFQLGSKVSYHELGRLVGMNSATIEKYVTMLEQSFVIYRLGSFSRNLRNELSKSHKIYFYDNGIRNALIGNFTAIETRTDAGALWENFFMSERLKLLQNNGRRVQRYFWRTTGQQEIDYVEEEEGTLTAFALKWGLSAKTKISKTFTKAYPEAVTTVVSPENYISLIT